MKGRGIGTARGRATIMRGSSLGHTTKKVADRLLFLFSKWFVYPANSEIVLDHPDCVIRI